MNKVIIPILNSEKAGNLCAWMIILTCFYYPLGVVVILFLKLPSTPLNIAIRTTTALVALYLIISYIHHNKKAIQFRREIWFLLLFWILYSIRLLYDMNRGIKFDEYDNSFVYGFAFGNILLPVIAIILWSNFIDVKRVVKISYGMFIINNLIILTILLTQNNLGIGILSTRPEIWGVLPSQKQLSILNPITISYYGEQLVVTSIYFLVIAKQQRKVIVIALLIGVCVLLLGASRGPFFNCIICLILMFLYKLKYSKSKIKLVLKTLLIVATLTTIISQTIGSYVSLEDMNLFVRFVRFSEERQIDVEEYRDIQFAAAWQDFLDSPIIGKQFVGTLDNFYPHNIGLELLMATGIVGTFIFLLFFIPFVKKNIDILSQKNIDYIYLVFIFLPIFLGTLFSGGLYQNVDFWLILTLILSIPIYYVTPKNRVL